MHSGNMYLGIRRSAVLRLGSQGMGENEGFRYDVEWINKIMLIIACSWMFLTQQTIYFNRGRLLIVQNNNSKVKKIGRAKWAKFL